MLLMIGDDWAEDHHDIEIEDETGRRLSKARLPEGLEGIARLHALVAQHAPADWAELSTEQAADLVFVGTETDRGPWVVALRGGRLSRVRDQPDVLSALPRPALHLRGQERRGRCPRPRRDRASGPRPPP